MGDSKPDKFDFKLPATRMAFKCNRCHYSCDSGSDLTLHLKTVHNCVKLFYCTFCKEIFEDQGLFIPHLSTCPGKPYKCNFVNCGERFPDLNQLEAHVIIHRTGPVEPGAKIPKPRRKRKRARDSPKVIVERVPLSLDDGEVRKAILERYEKNN